MNINSTRNTFDSARTALINYVNYQLSIMSIMLIIFITAETKISESFPTAQFAIDGFHKPLRLDVTDKSGGLIVYVRSYCCIS